MEQALYRKYRPKSLSKIVGQEHITTTLAHALKNGSISHAYLFSGPRGVGKTSIARILAHEINGLPYDGDASHLDIIEIDAASNRRIDEIRELRQKVHTAPASAKYKVYIIDEVHMLTREAFNALLKTLEEPPAHAIFILATTEAYKVPETIISRTQHFTFKPIDSMQVVAHLRTIAEQEKIKIEDTALELIAEHGEGSFRDSISLFDQVSTNGTVTLSDVQTVLGIAPEEAVAEVISLVYAGKVASLISHLARLRQDGYQVAQLSRQISQKLRTQLLESPGSPSAQGIAKLLGQLLAVPASHDPSALLEIVLLETAVEAVPEAAQAATPEPSPTIKQVKQPSEKAAAPPSKEKTNHAINGGALVALNETSWQQILQAIKRQHTTLYGIARMAVPKFLDNELVLSFAFPFHQKLLNEDKNRNLIRGIIEKQTGQDVVITCVVDKEAAAPQLETQIAIPEPPTSQIDAISNIFGDAEVLE